MARVLLAVLAALAVANVAYAAAGTYVAANIVETWDKCPVKKPVEWTPAEFDSSLDSLTNLAEFTKGLTQTCQDALLDLAGCASDNDALNGGTITSLSTSNGCCLTDCSTNIKKVVAQGCFDGLLKVICNDPKAAKYKAGLFNAGARCANFEPSCSATAAATKNATTMVTGAVRNATAAVANMTSSAANATMAAMTGAAAAVTKPATAGAAGAAASAVMALAGAAALLAL